MKTVVRWLAIIDLVLVLILFVVSRLSPGPAGPLGCPNGNHCNPVLLAGALLSAVVVGLALAMHGIGKTQQLSAVFHGWTL
jgi:hypothetical protein